MCGTCFVIWTIFYCKPNVHFLFSVLARNGLVALGGYTPFFCGDLVQNLVFLTIMV